MLIAFQSQHCQLKTKDFLNAEISLPDTFLTAYCYKDLAGWLKSFGGEDEGLLREDFQGVKKHN